MVSSPVPDWLKGTWLGGAIAHSILIPLWTLSPLPLVISLILLFQGGWKTMVAICFLILCVYLCRHTFEYRPWVVKAFYDLDLSKYYTKCEIAGPNLGSMPKEKNLFMFHPHGILATGFVVNGCWNKHFNELTATKDLDEPKSSGTVFLIARNLREWAPLFKVLCDFSGRLESATRENIMSLMSKGRNLAIIPGGFEDATYHKYGKNRTCMKPRKGLVKYALQNGYALTPVYSFGESQTYYTFTWLLKYRLMLNTYSIPGVLFVGNPFMPIFPFVQAKVLSYVGTPLQLPKIAEPTKAEIDEWHGKYLQALTDLFNAHKEEAGKLGVSNEELEIY